MPNSERAYTTLLHRATQKYPSWDPEVLSLACWSWFPAHERDDFKIAIKAGDWGRISQGKRPRLAFWRKRVRGTFVREGNIYTDGQAQRYGIPAPVEFGVDSEGQTWITSENAREVDLAASVAGVHPALAQCKVAGAYNFSSGRGAVLIMENATITIIDPPGALKVLFDDPSMRGAVVVSEVHRCSSYARWLSTGGRAAIALGLSVEPPIQGIASARASARWVRHGTSGYFRSQVNTTGDRIFYPLFRLVSHSRATYVNRNWRGVER
ncbi:hypothetical protein B0H16DRAFT_1810630 [Mycena metata]|uniref:Uncharacterized protein n=1 Tax=Mycena metata TaxID=1033252 RepID=A0AAD7H6R5_9AGAR|nr:hypothetical protein B0H16DRAFT_1810630 [Mycena metata]